MVKYLKLFDKHSDYQTYADGGGVGIDEDNLPNTSFCLLEDEVHYNGFPNYLCFTALESGTFTFSSSAGVTTSQRSYIEYSVDNGVTWVKTEKTANVAMTVTTPIIAPGGKVLWRGIGSTSANNNGWAYVSQFSSTGKYNVSGVLSSLFYGKDFKIDSPTKSGYYAAHLFYQNTGLINAKDLILSPIMHSACYYSTFDGCTNLTSIPNEIPSFPSNASLCCRAMYANTAIATLPTLPKSMSSQCYYAMFRGCNLLTTIPNDYLQATTIENSCYAQMFYDCKSLESVPFDLLPATTLANNCYQYMFFGCTNLVNTPNLPATTLANNCYYGMFSNCTSLIDVPQILPAMTLYQGCYYSMFYGCTSLEIAPELPALTLVYDCYNSMFRGCNSLNYIKMMATDIDAVNCIFYWVYQVASNGTFVRNPNATWWVIGQSGIPNGWLLEDGTEQSDEIIVFEDAEAKRVITSRYGGIVPDATYSSHWPIRIKGKVDGEITYRQAAHIASITQAFLNNTSLIKFHEFQYFTGIDGSGNQWFKNCKTLQEITLPNKDNLAIADSAFYQCRDITVFNNWDKVTTLNNNSFREVTGDFMNLVANLDFTNIKQWGGSVAFGNTAITSLYLPNVRITNDFYDLDNCTLIDIGHDNYIEFGTFLFWGWAAHECNLVFRCPAVIKTNWIGMDMHQNATGCIFNLYVYEKYYNDYVNDAYWSTANNIYKIGGAEWVAQFGSSDEWADYPNGQAPNADFTESEVEYARPLVGVNFDTKVIPTSNTHVVVRCRMTSTSNGAIIGLYESNSIRYVIQHLNGRFYFEVGSIAKNRNTDTNIHTFELYGNGTYVIDGTSYDIGDTLGTTTVSIGLLSRRGTNNSYGYQATNCELYSAKIYEGETLVKDYVPYRYRGGIYLKDKVSGNLEFVGYEENFEIGNDVN